GHGWMLLGDAAGLVDPITREGIYFALRSGELAAIALGGNAPSERYAAAVTQEIVSELLRAARFRRPFFQPAFLALLLTALSHSGGIRTVTADLVAGERPYPGVRRGLLGTFEFGLMLRAVMARRGLLDQHS